MDKNNHIKLGFIGEQGVGKTHIINRYLMDRLPENPASTIAVEFATTIFELKDGTRFKIELWDTAGHEKYKKIVCVHLKNADGIIIVYDLLNRKSFDEVKRWIQRIKQQCENLPVIMLFVEKNPSCRKVDMKEGQDIAKQEGFVFYQTSVKKPQIIERALEQMIQTIVLKNSEKKLLQLNKLERAEVTPVCGQCLLF